MAKCAICGKSVPLTLPPYMRAYKGEDGIWKAHTGICKCNKDMYDFCVTKLVQRQNKKSGKC